MTDRSGCEQGVPSSKHTVLFDKEHIRKIRNDFHTKFPGVNGESCADIHARTIPFFDAFILPHLAAGRNVLVSSHGFVIRTIIKHLDGMDADEFNAQMKLEKTAPERCLLLAPTGACLPRLCLDWATTGCTCVDRGMLSTPQACRSCTNTRAASSPRSPSRTESAPRASAGASHHTEAISPPWRVFHPSGASEKRTIGYERDMIKRV